MTDELHFGNYIVYDGPFFSAHVDGIRVRHHHFKRLCSACARKLANDGVPLLVDDDDPVAPGDDCASCGNRFGQPRLEVVE